MNNDLLIVIDVQKDFINKRNYKTLKKIENLVNSNKYKHILFTRFINTKESAWYKKLDYKGCLNKEGQKIAIDTKDYPIMDKYVYTVVNQELENYIKDNKIKNIYLCGFETDACIQKNAIDLFEKNYEIYVLKDYVMTYNRKIQNLTIKNLKRLIGEKYVI